MHDTAWQQRATTVEEAFVVLDPFALVEPTDPFFADIEAVLPREHYGVSAELKRHFRAIQRHGRWQHVGIVGHKGTGKTTLVHKAMQELEREQKLLPVTINAQQVLDQGGFRFVDMMLVIVRAVLGGLVDNKVPLSDEHVAIIEHWLGDELLDADNKREIAAKTRAASPLEALAQFADTLAGSLKSNNDRRELLRSRAEVDPRDVVRRVNLLLDGAHEALAEQGRQLCVVFDNLEKIDRRELVDEAVLRRGDDFRSLRCHLVLFFSPADQYAPRTTQASQAFSVVTVPVLPVRERYDDASVVRSGARDAIELLLSRRLVLDQVFADPDKSLDALARLSGGHVRDLLAIARRAGELAEPNQVTVVDIERASRRLASERLVLLRPQDWTRAASIARSNQIENRDEDSHLILHSCVLNYDGEPWWDVHPFLRGDDRLTRMDGEPR